MLGMITVLLLGCAAWAAALAASIATTLDATSPATTAETSAGNISRNSSLRAHKSSPDLPRSVLSVLGNGSRDGGSGHLEQLS
ncbi:hypothetical protein V8C86DRAFT_2891008 [Haematococcus lacustris]